MVWIDIQKAHHGLAVLAHKPQAVRELQRPGVGSFRVERQRREQGHEYRAAAAIVPDQERPGIVDAVLEGAVAGAKDDLGPKRESSSNHEATDKWTVALSQGKGSDPHHVP